MLIYFNGHMLFFSEFDHDNLFIFNLFLIQSKQEAEAAWKLTTIKKNCETAFI